MFVYMYVLMYVYICMYIVLCVYVCVCMWVGICIICVYECMYIYIYIYIYMCVCVGVCDIYMCVCVCVCVCVYGLPRTSRPMTLPAVGITIRHAPTYWIYSLCMVVCHVMLVFFSV